MSLRVAIIVLVPALVIAGYYYFLAAHADAFLVIFMATGAVATALGTAAALIVPGRKLLRLSNLRAFVVGAVVSGVLLCLIPYVPSWPFTGIGLIVGWVVVSFIATIVVLITTIRIST